ncbi:MAG: hypothetical protein HC779_02230, partial [Phyllobacteriaceae bacterium]|nr:hypothetical protein [Phyllobacteriaceae bacterium]
MVVRARVGHEDRELGEVRVEVTGELDRALDEDHFLPRRVDDLVQRLDGQFDARGLAEPRARVGEQLGGAFGIDLRCAGFLALGGGIDVAVGEPLGLSRRHHQFVGAGGALVVESGNYYFVGPDNGLFSFVYAREKHRRVFHATREEYFRARVSATFHGRDVFAPLILDGFHCDYAAARVAYKLKKDKLFLVSDALFLNRKVEKFEWDNFDATLIDGQYRNREGNLAGASISMADAVRNAVREVGISLEEA